MKTSWKRTAVNTLLVLSLRKVTVQTETVRENILGRTDCMLTDVTSRNLNWPLTALQRQILSLSDPRRHFSHICQVTFLCLVMALSQAGFRHRRPEPGCGARPVQCRASITRVQSDRRVHTCDSWAPCSTRYILCFHDQSAKCLLREEIVLAHWCQN